MVCGRVAATSWSCVHSPKEMAPIRRHLLLDYGLFLGLFLGLVDLYRVVCSPLCTGILRRSKSRAGMEQYLNLTCISASNFSSAEADHVKNLRKQRFHNPGEKSCLLADHSRRFDSGVKKLDQVLLADRP